MASGITVDKCLNVSGCSLDPRIKRIKQEEKEAKELKKAAKSAPASGANTPKGKSKAEEEEEKKKKEEEEKVCPYSFCFTVLICQPGC